MSSIFAEKNMNLSLRNITDDMSLTNRIAFLFQEKSNLSGWRALFSKSTKIYRGFRLSTGTYPPQNKYPIEYIKSCMKENLFP